MAYGNQASNQVFDHIVGQIRSGEWKPGMQIDTEAKLCEKLQVSRIAVRQAIEKLSALQVLTKLQGSGTYVTEFEHSSLMGLVYYPLNKKTMITVLEFRRMFDPYNTELFIKKCTDEDMHLLEKNYEKMLGSADNVMQFRFYDNEFHHIIAQGTHNVMIAQLSALMTDLLTDYQMALYHSTGPDHAIKYHGMILESIREKNLELAYIYSKTHIDNSLNSILERPDE
ncbi:FCD domain-containing protein [Oscillospiraceae bacterium MB08-C2-2]|nr:FCD domain-containing protein [Oscillospiraceae bacterium MB08-C2-2]